MSFMDDDFENYEFYEDWCDRSDDERDIDLEDFNEMMSWEVYGDIQHFDDDDDSNDPD